MHVLRHWPSWVALFCAGFASAANADWNMVVLPPPVQVAAPVGNARDAANDPNVRNLEAQFRPQFLEMLYVELAFVRRACAVEAKPFAEIAKAAKAHLHVTVCAYAVAQNQMMRGGGQQVEDANNPQSRMEHLLRPLVEAKLGHKQARRYRQECAKRVAGRKRAVVLCVVAAMDDHLVLTAGQREKLIQSLSKDYQSNWDQWVQQIGFNNTQYLPQISDSSVVSLLNDRQKAVWNQIQKVQYGVCWFGGFPMRNMGNSDQTTEIQEIANMVKEVPDD